MDVQMPITPSTSTSATLGTTSNGTTSTSAATGKANTSDTAKNSFDQVLGEQLGQEQPADSTDSSDETTSLAALLQMLQCLTMPMQPVEQNINGNSDKASKDQPLPEMLLQAMNTNADLAGQLLQNPKMKQWFEQAEQLLSSISDTPSGSGLQTNGTLNLQAQHTLLTLASLSKQQPDNPILQFLNQDLQNAVEPILPQLVASLSPAKPSEEQSGIVTQAVEGLKEDNKNEVSATSLRAHPKRANKSDLEQLPVTDLTTYVQPAKSKLELLAVKNALYAPVMQSIVSTEVPLEQDQENSTDLSGITNPMMTLNDLQKAQLASSQLDKPVIQTMNAANFSGEMTEHVLKNMKITLADGISEAKLSLFPKNLGHIDVKITMHEGQLVAQFAADTIAGKQMLESQLPQLRQALQTQGLQVEKLEVTQSQDMQSSMFQDQRNGQSSNQSQRQGKNRSSDYEVDALDFNQEIENVAQIRTSVHGNSFDVIA